MKTRKLPHYAQARPLAAVLLLAIAFMLQSCDRGASAQLSAARKFSDAVVRNDQSARDSMIATWRLRDLFQQDYVARDMYDWFRSFYDLQKQDFISTSRVDVDRDLAQDLQGGLIDTSSVEETGMVRIKTPREGEENIYFWMVKQRQRPWKVAMVTRGEIAVYFR